MGEVPGVEETSTAQVLVEIGHVRGQSGQREHDLDAGSADVVGIAGDRSVDLARRPHSCVSRRLLTTKTTQCHHDLALYPFIRNSATGFVAGMPLVSGYWLLLRLVLAPPGDPPP